MSDNPEQPSDLLTLQTIADALAEKYHRLRPFADITGIGPYLGAVNVKGVKGVRYEPKAVEQFRRLLEAKDSGVITISTALNYLTNIEGTPIVPMTQSSNADGNAELSQSGRQLYDAVTALVGRMDRVLEAGAETPPADRLVGREEAAGLLACDPARVSRYVKPVRRSVWRLSDIHRCIAGL